MFNDYLHNLDCYFRLERSFYEFFRLEAQTNKIDIKGFKAPYYNTTFSNGTPFMDGNPIFSARNEANGQILRVILEQDTDELVSYRDKELGCELVVIGNVNSLEEIKRKIAEWTKIQ
ncbi:hypothetical protein PHLH6_15710 [Pseudomonas sp. Seg1]|uniref:hypothetical protein n=1 Tax=Pseudomonas sp. Seg1 TaxID=2678259 RepID=UPI001BB416AD|nr:hypothetical protein [Pseudomonas sp. Seg1]BBP69567.1 hypothetical protein PHLH6_15710 [Pseudomonas sp. Seg1]